MNQLFYILLGLVSGTLGGLFGIGGAVILIPGMIYYMKLTQHQAQGTALAALLPPVGLLAVLRYWQAGNVKLVPAVFICAGFFIGGLLGAQLAQGLPPVAMKKIFGSFLFIVSLTFILGK